MTDFELTKRVLCYCHIDGEIVFNNENSIDYVGGRTIGVMLIESSSFEHIVQEVGEKLGKSVVGNVFRYTLEFDRKKLIDLGNDVGLKDLINFDDQFYDLYLFPFNSLYHYEECGR